ncbi:MAG: ABC transporter substrate-binding protein [Rhodocyclaceae bacterium]|nr:ABC transporter substrate-binding protein [Rhodocyclaceae bacterium]
MRKAWLVALLLLGCASPPEPALRLALNAWIGYDPFVLAQAWGLTDPRRLRVVELVSNSESQRAFANDSAEAAAMTLDEALRLADAGVPLRIIAVLDVSDGADAILARPEITTPSGLKGRRIGVETSAVGHLVLSHFLAHAGLSWADVDVVAIEAGQHQAALTGGRVDAIVTFEPIKSMLLRHGFRLLYDSRAMPETIFDVLVVRPEFSDTSRLLAAWREGMTALMHDPRKAAETLARGTGLSAEEYLAALQGLRFIPPAESVRLLTASAGRAAPLETRAQPIVKELLALGLLRQAPNWTALLAPGKEGR